MILVAKFHYANLAVSMVKLLGIALREDSSVANDFALLLQVSVIVRMGLAGYGGWFVGE